MRWKIVIWITLIATNLSHILLRKRKQHYTFEDYANMPQNSLGKTYHTWLNEAQLSFKPNLVRHDLKHVLLEYRTEMSDELRITAFLIGNRCYNPLSIAYLGLCLCIVPEAIKWLYNDFKRGRKSTCLKYVVLQDYVKMNLIACRKQLNISSKFNP